MKRTPVESSDVVSIGYDPVERILEIEFREGRIYRYMEVPQDIYDHFVKADSYGGYFNSYINGYFRYRKVEGGVGKTYDGIAIVTSNVRKVEYLRKACESFGIPVDQLELEIDEIQSEEPEKVALHKAKVAYRLAKRPIIVQDTFWSVSALGGFPGAYMAHINKWLKPEDWMALMHGKADRSIASIGVIVYYDGKKSKVFNRTRWGTIVEEPRGTQGSPLEHVIIMQGFDKTNAELAGEGKLAYKEDESVWHDFAKWYNMQRKLKLA
ncbi:MAG TPA: non-canonical purine NTP pyrophosphatase [Candidatus Saccharimonadales bacterium]|nr:non-canonical purine NTP pyrophosphatase [Candidatus Saccharimonadales bacterium]